MFTTDKTFGREDRTFAMEEGMFVREDGTFVGDDRTFATDDGMFATVDCGRNIREGGLDVRDGRRSIGNLQGHRTITALIIIVALDECLPTSHAGKQVYTALCFMSACSVDLNSMKNVDYNKEISQ